MSWSASDATLHPPCSTINTFAAEAHFTSCSPDTTGWLATCVPLVLTHLGLDSSLVCHPYDVAGALLLAEAGVVYEHPLGGFPDAPLDTTSGIAWVAYANSTLADLARPVLQRILRQTLLKER